MISHQIISSERVINIGSPVRAEWFSHLYSQKTDEWLFLEIINTSIFKQRQIKLSVDRENLKSVNQGNLQK